MSRDVERVRHELEQLHSRSLSWTRSLCVEPADDAEEVLQDAYVKVLSGRVQYRGASSVKTWFFGVIRLTYLEHRRARRARWMRWVPGLETLKWHLSERQNAGNAEALDQEMMSENVQIALKMLSRRQFQVLDLVFYHGLTLESASEVLGISVGSTRTHYARGKERLKHLLSTAKAELQAAQVTEETALG